MKYTLAYDSDCGPCRRFEGVVELLDTKHRLQYIGLEDADRKGLLATLAPSLRRRSFHLLSPSGRIFSGARAIPLLISLLPGGTAHFFVLSRSPLAFRALSFVYSVFSRAHDSGSCTY
jgi:predicted DCC family thiol-disulfide oxidoreductase YuxK